MIVIGLLVVTFPGVIARVYTSDPQVLVIAIPAVALASIVGLADGLQGVLIGALRGAADIWPTTWIGLTSFWIIMVPAAYGLAFALDLLMTMPKSARSFFVSTATAGVGKGPVSRTSTPAATNPASSADSNM
jgi:MATE family multidrug resistance protein